MAEFCLKCFVRRIVSDNDLKKIKVIRMSDSNDLCESCGSFTHYVESVSEYPEQKGNVNDIEGR